MVLPEIQTGSVQKGVGPRRNAALILIDVQQGFNEIAATVARNNPGAEACIARLLAAARAAGVAVIHIRHASDIPQSVFHPARPGFAVQPFAAEAPGEPVLVKSVNSAFIGTGLEEALRAEGLTRLFIAGATTNHCVETTARMAGNLGFETFLIEDACWTFDRCGLDGRVFPAADVHAMSLANLSGEFATIIGTEAALAAFAA